MAIIPVASNYYELIESESPGSITFKNGSFGVANLTFLVDGTELLQFIQDILGSSRLFANSYIRRNIPASHPLFAQLYANKIVSIKGVAPNGKLNSLSSVNSTTYKNVNVNVPEFCAGYKQWKITVQYEGRNYNILTDTDIDKFAQDVEYYQPLYLSSGEITESPLLEFRDHKEYLRYTNIVQSPKTEFLTYGVSNYYGINEAGATPEYLPIQNQTAGSNQILIQKADVKFQWYFVPYEFCINNKNWTDAYNKINYYDFILAELVEPMEDLYWYKKGTLLLKSVEVNKYEPYYPFELLTFTGTSVSDYFAQYNKNVYCDIMFNFLYFDGTTLNRYPAADYTEWEFKDANSFHNRLPEPNYNLWYYVESNTTPAKASSIYWSYPTQNIFNFTPES